MNADLQKLQLSFIEHCAVEQISSLIFNTVK